jgi:acetyl-CoA synthetase
VRAGDRVALHMGLLPETVVAMLACARLGAVHALMASALPADALADRLADLAPRILITQDGAWRHGLILPLKARADEAIPAAAAVEHTIVVRRTGIDVAWYEGDRWYDELLARPRPGTTPTSEPAQPVSSDHPLLVIYIANRRGRPTGIIHPTGGFLTYAASLHNDGLTSSPDDVLWCAAEIAWVTGQSHGVYGPLACGGTTVLYEGMLDTPTHARTWEMIERYRVSTLLTTPSVFRNLRRWADSPPQSGQIDSLRTVVTAGEATEPDLFEWIRAVSGAVVMDSWGQTELGGGVILVDTASEARPVPHPGLDVVDAFGRSVDAGVKGELVLREPWPGTFIGVQNGDRSATARYWEPGRDGYATGDLAERQPDGSFVFLGRIDPVVNVSGQLVSLTEVREALLEHPFIEDAEIVERNDPDTGQTLAACVVLADATNGDEGLARALRDHVRERLGGLAQPRTIAFVEAFPPGLPHDGLRQALRLLCARDHGETLSISAGEVLSACAPG